MWCKTCGYVLDGLSENRCPECARKFDPDNRRSYRRKPMRPRWFILFRRLVLGVTALALFVASAILIFLWRPIFDHLAFEKIEAWIRAHGDELTHVTTGPLNARGRGWRLDLANHIGLRTSVPVTDFFVVRFNDDGLSRVVKLAALEDLTLNGCSMSRLGIGHLSALSHLRALTIVHTTAANGTLNNLEKLNGLRELHLDNVCVTDDDLAYVKKIPSLETLYLGRARRCADLWPGDAESQYQIMSTQPPFWRSCNRVAECTGISGEGLIHLNELAHLKRLTLYNLQISDEKIALLQDMKSLEAIAINTASLTDAAVRHLAKLMTLKEVALESDRMTPSGLAMLDQLPNLKSLRLSERVRQYEWLSHKKEFISGEKIVAVSRLQRLESLNLSGTMIRNSDLNHLGALKNLRTLKLGGHGDGELQFLEGLQKLEHLNVAGTQVSDRGLRSIGRLRNLRKLDLAWTRINDRDILAIKDLTNLSELRLEGTAITDASVPVLLGFPRLQSLDVEETGVSAPGLKKLRSAPNLEVKPSWL
jgi:hypothetical protein